MTLAEIFEDLRSQGIRITKFRTRVLKTLYQAELPVCVSELVDCCKSHKTTMYRQLEVLKQTGHVKEVVLGDGKMRYELSHGEHHHHLVCEQCKTVQDVVLAEDWSEHEQTIARVANFQVLRHHLEFFGLCEDCRT